MNRAGTLALLAFLLAAAPARADWPMARHDSARRGAAKGKSDIQKPEIAWSAYLGGGVAGLRAFDIDKDGQSELIRVDGSAVAAVHPDGTEIWKTRTAGGTSILGITDLDGDGQPEIVTFTSLGVTVLDVASGAVRWAQPPSEMGRISVVRMGDLDGDGRPDLVIGECRGCGGDKPQSGFIYSFAGGFGAPKRVTIKYPEIGITPTTTILKLAAGGARVLGESPGGERVLVDPATGAVSATSPALGLSGGGYVPGCVPADLDGVPGEEAICFYTLGGEPTPGPTDPSKAFALKPNANGTALDVLWTRSFAPTEAMSADGYQNLVDLDDDGAPEMMITGRNASGAHTVHILAASTGKELATVPGGVLGGVAGPIPTGGRPFVVNMDGGGLAVFRYTPNKVTSIGSLSGTFTMAVVDEARVPLTSANPTLLTTLDIDGDGHPELFTYDTTTTDLRAFSLFNTTITPLATAHFTPDRPLTGAWPLPPMDRPFAQLGFGRADGTLHYFDEKLIPTASSVRFGGYYLPGGYRQLGRTQIVASLDGSGPQQILVSDSRHVLIRLDASGAKPDVPPKQVWEQLVSFSPIVAPSKDGPALFVLHSVDPPKNSQLAVRRLDAGGAVLWETPIDGFPPADILPGDFDGDGVPDVLVQSGVVNAAELGTAVLSGVDGHVIWKNTFSGCNLPGGPAVIDWDGDGLADVVQQSGATQVFSGLDGSIIAQGGPDLCYGLPVMVDADGDGADELVLTAVSSGVRVYSHDLDTALWAASDADQAFPYGSVADCPNGPVLASGSWAFPSRLELSGLGGNIGQTKSIFLVGGALYTDQATADAHGTAQLTAANVHANLTGNGSPVVVVGSGDGFLYAVDPCNATLLYTYDFQAAVGEPIFGDTDGDGRDEILVSVADGYLYALRNVTMSTGTGGSSGTGATGGVGGVGGAPSGATYPITGRAGLGCYCNLDPSSPAAPAPAALAAAIAALVIRRRRRATAR